MCVIDLEPCDVWSEVEYTARKPRRCHGCRAIIQAGERYTAHFSKLDGEVCYESLCGWCWAARAQFATAHHGAAPAPSSFETVLEECVYDGDEASQTTWGPMLAALRSRRAAESHAPPPAS